LVYYTSGTGTPVKVFTHETAISVSTWYHIAACSDGSTVRLFLDGVEGATTDTATVIFNATEDFRIMAIHSSGVAANFFDGWVDNVRITKGTARYIADFTPPTKAFGVASVVPVKV
jgi:hypothetical protein